MPQPFSSGPIPKQSQNLVLPGARLTHHRTTRSGVTLGLSAPVSIRTAYEDFRVLLSRSSYSLLVTDFEGFEAEIYFRKGSNIGVALLREGPCETTSISINITQPD